MKVRIPEMDMYVFSKPMERREDLYEWERYFKHHPTRPRSTWIRQRTDGKFDLLVEGIEKDASKEPEPCFQRCKMCGSLDAPEICEGGFIPIFFCGKLCMDMYGRMVRRKHENTK